jgi:hypothetical protein
MTFTITFFCRTEETAAPDAFAVLMDAISSRENVRVHDVKIGDGWVACEIAPAVMSDGTAPQEPVMLEVHSDRLSVESTVKAFGAADNSARIADTDLLVTITMVGQTRDWSVVRAIWLSITQLWSAVPCSDVSGFDIDLDSLT